jgi:predicted RNA-binding protein with PUA-like domain
MNYWLVKSEPSVWSWDQQVAKGAKGEAWTGVRNFTARQNLVNMKKGDKAFFYHSNEGKEIVGIVEVIREAYPDHTAEPGSPWVMVDIKFKTVFPHIITRDMLAADPVCSQMLVLKRGSRLSILPVTPEEWHAVHRLAQSTTG